MTFDIGQTSSSELSREDTHSQTFSFTQSVTVGTGEESAMNLQVTLGFGEAYTDSSTVGSTQTVENSQEFSAANTYGGTCPCPGNLTLGTTYFCDFHWTASQAYEWSPQDWTGTITYSLAGGTIFSAATSGTVTGSYYNSAIDQSIVCTAASGDISSRKLTFAADMSGDSSDVMQQAVVSTCSTPLPVFATGKLSMCSVSHPTVAAEVFCAGVPPELLPGVFAASSDALRSHFNCSGDGSATHLCCPPKQLFLEGKGCVAAEPSNYNSVVKFLSLRNWRVCDGDRIPVCSSSRVDAAAIDPDMRNTTKTVSAVTTTACTYQELRKRAICKDPSNMYICSSLAGYLFAPGTKTSSIISCYSE